MHRNQAILQSVQNSREYSAKRMRVKWKNLLRAALRAGIRGDLRGKFATIPGGLPKTFGKFCGGC